MRKSNRLQTLLLFTFSLFLFACSSGESGPGNGSASTASLRLEVARSSVPLADSLVLDLVGPDTLHFVLNGDSNALYQKLSAGEWNFYAQFYANGILVQKGETQATLSSGEESRVTISMHAVAGFLYVRIPLGLENSRGVASGTLVVGDTACPFQIQNGEATAATGILEMGKTYTAQIHLFSSKGDTLYVLHSDVKIDEENFSVSWILTSLQSELTLEIVRDSLKTFTAEARLPSKSRKASRGDILISEFMTEGKMEFVEIYNASLDTLILDGCTLWATSSSSTKIKLVSDSMLTAKLLPDAYFVFGKDSVLDIDAQASLALAGTKGSIVFRCGDETLDSLFYANESTVEKDSLSISAFNIDSKKSLQLPLENFRNRLEGSSWCVGEFTLHAKSRCEE